MNLRDFLLSGRNGDSYFSASSIDYSALSFVASLLISIVFLPGFTRSVVNCLKFLRVSVSPTVKMAPVIGL